MSLQVNKDEVATQVRVAFREGEEAKISELTTHSSVVDVQYYNMWCFTTFKSLSNNRHECKTRKVSH